MKTSFGIEMKEDKSMKDKTYEKIFARLSGHFLTQELPDNWSCLLYTSDAADE